MFSLSTKLIALSLAAATVQARTINLHNNCPFTVWPAFFTGVTSNGVPQGPTGFSMDQNADHPLYVPDSWTSGRIWARTACDFSKPDVQSCETGSCLGGLECTQPGIPPVTLAEFTLAQNGQDNYDVSNVDGSSIPVSISGSGSSGACPDAGCYVDLNPNCPADLRLTNANGVTVGCKSACLAHGGDNNCCTGPNDTRDTCPTSGVADYDYFHGNCPKAYAYAYDDSIALFQCTGNPNYQVTFCP